MKLHDVGVPPLELDAVEGLDPALGPQLEQELELRVAVGSCPGQVPELLVVGEVHAGPGVGDEVVLVPVAELGPLDGQALPLALEPVWKGAGGGLLQGGLRGLELLQMEGLIPVLSRVEVVGAGGVGAESHVGQPSVGVLFEKLKQKVKTFLFHALRRMRFGPKTSLHYVTSFKGGFIAAFEV